MENPPRNAEPLQRSRAVGVTGRLSAYWHTDGREPVIALGCALFLRRVPRFERFGTVCDFPRFAVLRAYLTRDECAWAYAAFAIADSARVSVERFIAHDVSREEEEECFTFADRVNGFTILIYAIFRVARDSDAKNAPCGFAGFATGSCRLRNLDDVEYGWSEHFGHNLIVRFGDRWKNAV